MEKIGLGWEQYPHRALIDMLVGGFLTRKFQAQSLTSKSSAEMGRGFFRFLEQIEQMLSQREQTESARGHEYRTNKWLFCERSKSTFL